MRRRQLLASILMFLSVCALALSAPEGGLTIPWFTFDAGGGASAGGEFDLAGAIGQPDAGVTLSGGDFELAGGLWPGATPPVNNCPANIITTGASAASVDVDDMLEIFMNWGGCELPCPPRCAADIAPLGGGGQPQGDCAVGVNDLLVVIMNWGACP